MIRSRITARCTAVGLPAAIACLQPSQSALADVTAVYTNWTAYSYDISHVPDFDQKRLLLPNTGNQYCVPTSAINWMAYFANHGEPSLAPGPGNWQSDALYNDATNAIATMGTFMGTDPYGGTGGNGAMAGLLLWSGLSSTFVTSHYYNGFWWSPNFQDISMAVFQGGYVIPIVGWYSEIQPGVIQRNGGHALSLTYGARSGSSMEIGWRDPARDEQSTGNPMWLMVQSPFATETYDIEQRLVTPEGNMPRFMSKVVGYGSAYIDEFFAFYPQFVVTSSPDLLLININHAFQLFGSANPQASVFGTAQGTPLIDLVVHADLGSYLYIADAAVPSDPAQVWRLNPVTGESTLIDIPLVDPSDLLVGRRRSLYVVDGSDVVCINVDLPEPEEVTRITPPSPCAAMTYDDDADELVLLSLANREILRYPYHLDAQPTILPIPTTVPLGGRGSMTWDRSNGCAWVVSDGSDSLFQLAVDPFTGQLIATEVSHPQLIAPKAVDVNDAGRVFVSSQGQILEFEEVVGVKGTTWQLVADPLFPDVAAGDFLQIAKSHTNYDPLVHTEPEWNDVPPAEEFGDSIPDCVADLDNDGEVGPADRDLLVAAWGPCDPNSFCHEDLDYSGDVGDPDLALLLEAWGPCPGPPCPADLNGDGLLNFTDLTLLLTSWVAGTTQGDIGGPGGCGVPDGVTDFFDLSCLLAAWAAGGCP